MRPIGCHLTSTKGYLAMGKEAVRIGATTFQFFTRNPRGSRAKALNMDDVHAFTAFAEEHRLGPIMGHAAYTLNAAAEDEAKQDFAQAIMADDIARLDLTPGAYYTFHPGRHARPQSDEAVRLVARTLQVALRESRQTVALLETMTGHGTEVGGTFEILRAIIDAAALGDKLGVCLDTCHVYAAGYDIVNDLEGVLTAFDRIVGLERLCAVHCNDSVFPLGSGRDRHARIGEGAIGHEGFRRIMRHPALRTLPFYLETRNDPDGHGREIALLHSLAL